MQLFWPTTPLMIHIVHPTMVGALRRNCTSNPQRFTAGQNEKWPKKGPGGYITPTAEGVPNASERGADLEVAHKWAGW